MCIYIYICVYIYIHCILYIQYIQCIYIYIHVKWWCPRFASLPSGFVGRCHFLVVIIVIQIVAAKCNDLFLSSVKQSGRCFPYPRYKGGRLAEYRGKITLSPTMVWSNHYSWNCPSTYYKQYMSSNIQNCWAQKVRVKSCPIENAIYIYMYNDLTKQ